MCSNVPDTLPNTHDTLTATIASGSDSGALSIVMTPSLGTTTATQTETSPTTTEADTAGTQDVAPSSLSAGQISGIVVGAVGSVMIVLFAILLIKRTRRRKYLGVEEGYSTSSDEGRHDDPSTSDIPRGLVISPPFRNFQYPQAEPQPPPRPPRFDAPLPNVPILPVHHHDISNPSPPPNSHPLKNSNKRSIGLAISPPRNLIPPRSSIIGRSTSQPQLRGQPVSALHPRGPIHDIEPVSHSQAAATRTPISPDRASTLTNNTAFADLDAEVGEGVPVLLPPRIDAQEATNIFMAKRLKSRVVSQYKPQSGRKQVPNPAELDTYTPLTKSPIERREEEEALAMAAAISAASALPEGLRSPFVYKARANRTRSRSSSIYSQASIVRRGSRGASTHNSLRHWKNNGFKLTRTGTSKSHDTVTTINTCASTEYDTESPCDPDNVRKSHLSTVMERHPSPPIQGRSPVTYPEIPGRRSQTSLRARESLTNSSSNHSSPALRSAATPTNSNSGLYPEPLDTKRSQMSYVSKWVIDPALEAGSSHYESQSEAGARNSEVYLPLRTSSSQALPPHLEGHPALRTRSSEYGSQSSDLVTTPYQLPTDETIGLGVRPAPGHRHSPLSMATMSSSGEQVGDLPTTGASGTSSLLAKRIGNAKAAALAFSPTSRKRKAQRVSQSSILASFPHPPPPDPAEMAGSGTLPQTPIWQPKLTPTRKGGDLYLNVQ